VRVDVRLGVRVDVRASGWGACSAAHIIFIRLAIEGIRSITDPPLETWPTIGGATFPALLRMRPTFVRSLPFTFSPPWRVIGARNASI
jgi:hypothetical protein